ncbi:S8 family serine peptidase [Oricola sp.]|uniref:S8 family serine peptidase n=1 Tax=Oricola sp. TaxID=1979950 RepID=UPI003BAB1BA4
MRRLAILFCLAVLTCAGFKAGTPSAQAQTATRPGEMVVLISGEDAARALIEAAADAGYVLNDQHDLAALGDIMIVLTRPAGRSGPDAIAELEALAPGSTAGVNHLFSLQAGVAAGKQRRYAHAMIGWPADGCSARHTLGLVDAAVDVADPALAGTTLFVRDFTGAAADIDHGTEMAALLVGEGRLRDATLYAAGVVDRRAGGEAASGVDSIVKAIDWLAGNGVRIVNVSLAGPYNKILDRGLSAAAAHGLVIVAAAGNGGPRSDQAYPAKLPTVIAVTAVDAAGKVHRRAVQGDHIDIAAPGVDVAVPVSGAMRYVSGTSAAAPFVATFIAATARPGALSLDNVRAALADHTLDLGTPGRDTVFGDGLLSVGGRC